MKLIKRWATIKSERRAILILLMILFIGSAIILLWNNYKDEALKEGQITWAVIDDITSSKGGHTIDIHFVNDKGEEIYIDNVERLDNCLESRRVGDTVTIKYSLKNNSIAQIIKCYWKR